MLSGHAMGVGGVGGALGPHATRWRLGAESKQLCTPCLFAGYAMLPHPRRHPMSHAMQEVLPIARTVGHAEGTKEGDIDSGVNPGPHAPPTATSTSIVGLPPLKEEATAVAAEPATKSNHDDGGLSDNDEVCLPGIQFLMEAALEAKAADTVATTHCRKTPSRDNATTASKAIQPSTRVPDEERIRALRFTLTEIAEMIARA